MKADLTRATFDRGKRFARVVHQQERVILDADLNEQHDIDAHRIERGTEDALGPCATPIGPAGSAPGFELLMAPGQEDVLIGVGHFYVDGILAENQGRAGAAAPASGQADLPPSASPIVPAMGQPLSMPAANAPAPAKLVQIAQDGAAPTAPADGVYVGFLDVWRRHVTALEDDDIREVALGGPDTATRLQTMAQVKFLRVDPDPNAALNCSSALAPWAAHVAASSPTGRMAAQAEPTKPPRGPCVIAPKAGYRRLENQLYRVEIHEGGTLPGGARLKWSRDNGSIVVRCVDGQPKGPDIKVTTLGRDKVLTVAVPGAWVELIDDVHERLDRPGQLLQVVKAQDDIVTVATDANLPDFPANPRLRRWDGVADARMIWTPLEDGIEVRFEAGTYVPGDYWLVPARTATGGLQWPRVGNVPTPVARRGPQHHLCKLALLKCAAGRWTLVDDCRPTFPQAADLVQLSYVGGDGQEATPDPLQPQNLIPLARSLEVGVSKGRWPVSGAAVRFTVTRGAGTLANTNAISATVPTDAGGIAAVTWAVDAVTASQTVEAVLLGDAGAPPIHLPVRFTAELRRAQEVSYDPAACDTLLAAQANTVQKAIDVLCRQGHGGGCDLAVGPGQIATLLEALEQGLRANKTGLCICLAPGDHEVAAWPDEGFWKKLEPLLRGMHLRIAGCGRASRLLAGVPLRFRFFASVTLERLEARSVRGGPLVQAAEVGELALRDVTLSGTADRQPLVSADGGGLVCERSALDAVSRAAIEWPTKILEPLPGLRKVLQGWERLEDMADDLTAAVEAMREQSWEYRMGFAERLRRRLDAAERGQPGLFTPDERQSYDAFFDAYSRRALKRDEIVAALLAIRDVAGRERPGWALNLDSVTADARIVANRFRGLVSVEAPGPAVRDDRLHNFADKAIAGGVTFDGGALLTLTGNVLDTLRVSAGAIDRAKETKGILTGIFRRAVVNDNVFSRPGTFLLSSHAHLGANLLAGQGRHGDLVSRTAALVGNTAIDPKAELRCSAAAPAVGLAANIDLVVTTS